MPKGHTLSCESLGKTIRGFSQGPQTNKMRGRCGGSLGVLLRGVNMLKSLREFVSKHRGWKVFVTPR